MKLRIAFSVFPALVLLSSCGASSSSAAMAADLCRCMQPMAESMALIKELSVSGRPDELDQAMRELDETGAAVDACMTDLEKQYGEALTTEEGAIKESMAAQCPDVVAAMEAAGAIF